MIDEEMAEQYTKELCKTCTVDTCRYNTLKTCAIKESIKQAFLAGLNKANEWHYVKDGKYPKENQLVMVYRVNPLGANIAITNWYDSYKDTKVIAWKEVILPELPKESE